MSDQMQPSLPEESSSPTEVTTIPSSVPPTLLPEETLWDSWRYWAVTQVVTGVPLLVFATVFGVLFHYLDFHWKDCVGYGLLTAFLLVMFFLRQTLLQAVSKAYPGLLPPAPTISVQVTTGESVREVGEMFVFVVVLVLILRAFVAEAFVIPTGSMAETLWGYQKVVTCPQCGMRFPLNCSDQVEKGLLINHGICPNCRQPLVLVERGQKQEGLAAGEWARDYGPYSGDRVLVLKYPFDVPGLGPNRLDVVVFRFPGDDGNSGPFPQSGPFKNHTALNYIKRLIGLPGETLAIHRGNVYVLPPELSPKYPGDQKALEKDPSLAIRQWQTLGPRADGLMRARQRDWMHQTEGNANESTFRGEESEARQLFIDGKYNILRKPPALILEVMRLVYDNDLPAKDLLDKPDHRRWVAEDETWTEIAGNRSFRHLGSTDKLSWLRYRHVLRDRPGEAQLITDFLGYNGNLGGNNWASDLVVECTVDSAKSDGQFVLELAQGPRRFQASFDVATGECTLNEVGADGKVRELKKQATPFKGTGTFDVRFANVDDRLTLWVNGALPFGEGVEFVGLRELAPEENDVKRPVGLGVKGGQFTVRHLKVYRDLYYTVGSSFSDVSGFSPTDPRSWGDYKTAPLATYYVQPGHYFCLGDNSPQSADSRSWGLVPQRLMLGRAVMVYYPFTRFGRIR